MPTFDGGTDLEDTLDCDCDLFDQCCDDGCLFRIMVGPCDAINMETGEFDPNQMCTPKTATAHTPNFIRPLREKTYRNSCVKQRVRGTPDCNFDIDIDICNTDPAIKYLLDDCPIAVAMIPLGNRYDSDLPAAAQPIAIIRGRFIGSDWSWNNEFEECQSTSRNFSCTGQVWGIKQWLDQIVVPETLTAASFDEVRRSKAA